MLGNGFENYSISGNNPMQNHLILACYSVTIFYVFKSKINEYKSFRSGNH